MTLFPFQETAVQKIYNLHKFEMKDSLLYLPTGTGKTEIALDLIKRFYIENKRIGFILRRRHLVYQTYRRFMERLSPSGIKVAKVMASETMDIFSRKFSVFICSFDTLISRPLYRAKVIQDCDVLFIDEAHDTTSDSYQKFLKSIPDTKFIIGMSATPFKIGNRYQSFWTKENVVNTITPREAMESGYLCNMKFLCPPSDIMYKNLKKNSAGEYTDSSVFSEMNKQVIYGKYKERFLKYGEGKKTITFCINVNHSKAIEKTLKEDLNQKFVFRIDCYLSAKKQLEIREGIREAINSNNTFHLINVNMFSTGIDIPSLSVGFMLRPTTSKVLWDQQVGRLTRVFPGKEEAIIIDFTKNCYELFTPFHVDRLPEIDGNSDIKSKRKIKFCPACFFLVKIYIDKCPECGYVFKKGEMVQKKISEEDTKLVDFNSYMNVKKRMQKINLEKMEELRK